MGQMKIYDNIFIIFFIKISRQKDERTSGDAPLGKLSLSMIPIRLPRTTFSTLSFWYPLPFS